MLGHIWHSVLLDDRSDLLGVTYPNMRMLPKPAEQTHELLQELIEWECVICDKIFRSEKALANHER
jgi:Zinc-finger double-stranded RNA-binding